MKKRTIKKRTSRFKRAMRAREKAIVANLLNLDQVQKKVDQSMNLFEASIGSGLRKKNDKFGRYRKGPT